MILVIVRERYADHEENRQNRKDENAGNRKCEQRLMEIAVKKRKQYLFIGRKFLAFFKKILFVIVLPNIFTPYKYESYKRYDRQKTEKKNEKAVVTVDRDSVLQATTYQISAI